ncbi:DNA alkylation repair protein [Streptomyces sp. NPDC048717]|uniref:DNA alkylation repair protein n=1 Tax=Streptomyces sp. NPDC048717 TaxID=3154928 RepID=UPI00342FC5C6
MSSQVPLKERALSPDRIARIGREMQAACPGFDAASFTAQVNADLPALELKARIARTAEGLHQHLPVTGPAALDALLRSLPATPEAAGAETDFGLYTYAPHSAYVAAHHLHPDRLDQAFSALATLTPYFSAEDAVRSFLNAYPQQTLAAAAGWAAASDHRVRRLASEATRPHLPWSAGTTLPVDTALPLLDTLYADTSRFVTTSVANHLRDISRTKPDLVLATLTRWRTEGRATDTELTFITREALKTRLKDGWAPAYTILGYDPQADVSVSPLRLPRTHYRLGGDLTFEADLTAPADTRVHVMYVLTRTAPGAGGREKTAYLTRTTAKAGTPLRLAKTHTLKSTGTAALAPGSYHLALQVNGRRHPPVPLRITSDPTS